MLGTVREFLEHGTDATVPDGEGRTPIEILESRGELNTPRKMHTMLALDKITKLLEDSGCPPLAAPG